MKFSRRKESEPDINLVPFIDILLVVLIFLMMTTTFTKMTEVQLKLPVADVEAQKDYPKELTVTVNQEGRYWINDDAVLGTSIELLATNMKTAARQGPDTVVIIKADALSPHQSVISVMEAARRAGLQKVTFGTQPSKQEK